MSVWHQFKKRDLRYEKTWLTLPIYSEGSNECTFIQRWKFLTLHKFYMSKVYNWISWNFFIGYKMPQNRKIGKKIGEKLMKSLGWFRHCKWLHYINHWYKMLLYDQYIPENKKKGFCSLLDAQYTNFLKINIMKLC